MSGDVRRRWTHGWSRPLVMLWIVLGVLLPAEASAERVLADYRVTADLRKDPAAFELRITYRDPDLSTAQEQEQEQDTEDLEAMLREMDGDLNPNELRALIARRQMMEGRRATARIGEDLRREEAQQKAQQGFKFAGEERITKYRAKTPDGREVETYLSREYDEIRLEYEIPLTSSGESTVVLSFRQEVDLAQQRGFFTFSTEIPWIDQWKLPVERMEVELLFPSGVTSPTNWECERDGDATRCHRVESSNFPVIVLHEPPGFSAVMWFPPALLLVFVVAVMRGFATWRRAKGVVPSAPPGTSWTPPEPLDVKERLSEVDRKAFITRVVVLAILSGVLVLLMVNYAQGRSWISFGGQLVVFLIALAGGLTVGLSPTLETGTMANMFGWILAFVVGVLLLELAFTPVLFVVCLFGMFIPFMLSGTGGGGGGGGGGSFSSSCSSCSSCGSSCGGGCGGGCGGCGG